jgi:hypothetical protein
MDKVQKYNSFDIINTAVYLKVNSLKHRRKMP